ncbi:DUF7518 family protein [Methanoplanus endosymbiosus]|uniref:Uncharacterized protein n=1 Tax=Methanoplanus endosymbiosus TaxID=33865 RepID=A0A9E7PP27_9EURY|nr:hypothetical protein [Methanoplanus endosymbiosus]UUX93475.1 hypothetical protein L6E24_04990 [Methanoplanus endosymbiosus]
MDINDSSARIRDLEHTVGEKEREIEMLKDSVREMTSANPVSDDRVKALEREISEMKDAGPAHDDRMKALEREVSEMKDASPEHDERVKALEKEISEMKDASPEHDDRVIALEREVSEIKDASPEHDERVKSLERQVNEMSGMVRGLTAEMLDLKAWIQKLSRSLDENGADNKNVDARRTAADNRRPVTDVRRPATDNRKEADAIKERRNYPVPEKPVDIAVKKSEDVRRREEKERSEEVLIIQPDGTMKPERMKGDGMIIADNRGGHIPVRRASERDPRDRKPLIYADDDDAVEITKKRK